MRDVGDAIPYRNKRTLQPQNRSFYVKHMLNNVIHKKALEFIKRIMYN